MEFGDAGMAATHELGIVLHSAQLIDQLSITVNFDLRNGVLLIRSRSR